jgi:hypothetical protein
MAAKNSGLKAISLLEKALGVMLVIYGKYHK